MPCVVRVQAFDPHAGAADPTARSWSFVVNRNQGISGRRVRHVGGAELVRPSFAAKHPLGRIAAPEEVAAAVLYLASDDAGFVTGIALPIDGGLTAR